MPQGFIAARDTYTRRYDEIIADIKRKVKISNDVLLHDDDMEEHFYRVLDYLTFLYENEIVANMNKSEFARFYSVNFAGLQLTKNRVALQRKCYQLYRTFHLPKT